MTVYSPACLWNPLALLHRHWALVINISTLQPQYFFRVDQSLFSFPSHLADWFTLSRELSQPKNRRSLPSTIGRFFFFSTFMWVKGPDKAGMDGLMLTARVALWASYGDNLLYYSVETHETGTWWPTCPWTQGSSAFSGPYSWGGGVPQVELVKLAEPQPSRAFSPSSGQKVVLPWQEAEPKCLLSFLGS